MARDELTVVRLTPKDEGLWNWEQASMFVEGSESAEIRGSYFFLVEGYRMPPLADTPICQYVSLNAGAQVSVEETLEDGGYDEPLLIRYSVAGDTLTTFEPISLSSSTVYCYAKYTFKRRE